MSWRLKAAGAPGSAEPAILFAPAKTKMSPDSGPPGKDRRVRPPGEKPAASGLPKKKRRPDSEKKTRVRTPDRPAPTGNSFGPRHYPLSILAMTSPARRRVTACRAPAAPVRPHPPACSDRIPSRRPDEITSRGRVHRRPAEGPVTAPRIRLCCRPGAPRTTPSLLRAPSSHARRERRQRRRRRRPGGRLNPCGSGGGRATCGCRSACGGAPGQPAPRRGSDEGGGGAATARM